MAARGSTGEEEGGEGYFASVSDLMVGILFIFLLMLAIFALNLRDTEHVAKEEFERQQAEAARQREANATLRALLNQTLAELERELQDRARARDQMLADIAQRLDRQGIRITIDHQSGILRIAGDLLFETGSAGLGPEARRVVGLLGDALVSIPPCYTLPDATCPANTRPVLGAVLVEGHTDRRPVTPGGRFRDNDQHSTERALAVFGELRGRQPRLGELRTLAGAPLLGVSGYGERRPLEDARGDSPDELRRNRRIDLRFVLAAPGARQLEEMRQKLQQARETP